ncbi:hypothetical protein [Thalassolituus alkanivorans]|uniref:hypothetical protein n=1 Tax=Thalassolituus alkanivorans TaxID=2881055 RepID=UPI001E6596B2|nr:hypothetical protein [Thalassolituus alkanivorans]MCB2387447.1 hypothetical protein [Thalassolituus alkanivorans]MCB2425128.1 hypothetical protein [Thalassolituus alkanivorans]
MIEIQETYKDCLRIVIAEAGVSNAVPEISSDKEPDKALRKLLSESKPIEVTDDSAHYEIVFDDYIAYAVTNESYDGGIEEKFEGRLARIYSESAFLNYIGQGTFATEDYPGPFVHYGFCCLNQIIDVVSERPPTVKLINA